MVKEMFYIPSLSFSKLAVLAFYWRIFNSVRSAKVSIIILTIIAILWLVVRVSSSACVSAYTLFMETYLQMAAPNQALVANSTALRLIELPSLSSTYSIAYQYMRIGTPRCLELDAP